MNWSWSSSDGSGDDFTLIITFVRALSLVLMGLCTGDSTFSLHDFFLKSFSGEVIFLPFNSFRTLRSSIWSSGRSSTPLLRYLYRESTSFVLFSFTADRSRIRSSLIIWVHFSIRARSSRLSHFLDLLLMLVFVFVTTLLLILNIL